MANDRERQEEKLMDSKAPTREDSSSGTFEGTDVSGLILDFPTTSGGEPKWYIIHTMSGHEEKVKELLERRIRSFGLEDKVEKIIIPKEEIVKIHHGRKKVSYKRIFPGYIFIKMVLDNDTWKVVRGTQGVTGFVGPGGRPMPISETEFRSIQPILEGKMPTKKVEFKSGDQVKIVSGPFKDSFGIVEEVDLEKGKAKVLINLFGRDTPVEIDFAHLEKQ